MYIYIIYIYIHSFFHYIGIFLYTYIYISKYRLTYISIFISMYISKSICVFILLFKCFIVLNVLFKYFKKLLTEQFYEHLPHFRFKLEFVKFCNSNIEYFEKILIFLHLIICLILLRKIKFLSTLLKI